MHRPQFSVIVAAFNAASFIDRCIRSVLNQPFEDFELIIINDGSTDKTEDIIFILAEGDTRIHYYYQRNKGISSARNLGLASAQGEWILFLDADDELLPNALSSFSGHLKDGYDCIIGGYVTHDETGLRIYEVPDRIETVLNREDAVSLMYSPLYYRYLGYCWGKCFRASFIHEWWIRFNQQVFFNEDRLFTTQYLCRCDQVLFFTHPVYKYYEHPGSAMSSTTVSFNPKFITDLDGYIGMKRSIEAINGSDNLIQFAQEGIISSYKRIKEMMNTHNNKQLKYLLLLEKKLIEGLSFPFYLKFRLKVLRDKCLNGNSRSSVSAS